MIFLPTDTLLYFAGMGLESLSEHEATFVAFLAADVAEAVTAETDEHGVAEIVEAIVREMGAPEPVWSVAYLVGQAAHRVRHLSDN